MDYTKNYHLPQWVDEDRIRRIDFNDAMANIENGLSQGDTDRAALCGALMRQACNYWRRMAALSEAPWQEGFFRQGFAKGENSAIGRVVQLDDRIWTTSGNTPLRFEDIEVEKLSNISSEQGTDTCSFTFTLPIAGYMKYFLMKGYFKDNKDKLVDGAAVLRIYNDETGTLLEEQSTFVGGKTWQTGNLASGVFRNDVDRIFHAGTRYRIELQINALEIPCSYTLGANDNIPLVFLATGQEGVTLTRQLQTEEESRCGVVLARYDAPGCTAPLSVSCLGETLAPYALRDVTFGGKTVKEAEFRINRTIPADCTLALNIHCDNGGELNLYDWGAVLI